MKPRRLPVSMLGLLLCIPVASSMEPPPTKQEKTPLPPMHGIAAFGTGHHVDLVMLILGREGDPKPLIARVRKELGLEDKHITGLHERFQPALEKSLQKLQAKEADGGLDEAFAAADAALLKHLPKVFSKQQQARFEELGCQFAGPMALRLEPYTQRLRLSMEQQRKIGELVERYMGKTPPLQRQVFVAQSVDAYSKPATKLAALACELDEKILTLLSPEQRTQWEKLLGKPFDWSGGPPGSDR